MTEKRFIEQFEENVRLYPDKVILRDEHNSLTFRELDELSGRVYAYLQTVEIKREDIVMVYMPRGIYAYVAVLGVWKSGAACVMVDEGTPIERMTYIYEDCKCVSILGKSNWDVVLSIKSVTGHTATDVHDAAFVMYTSGSEGKPKGVLHEYGKLDICYQSWIVNGECILRPDDIHSVASGLSTAICHGFAKSMYLGVRVDIPSVATVMNIDRMIENLISHQVTVFGFSPTYIKSIMQHKPKVRLMIVGMEIANNVYSDEVKIINLYSQTESSIVVCAFFIDKPYEVTPIGQPTAACNVVLLDDDGEISRNGIGELCYKNRYSRGYLNMPEQACAVNKDGLYHTGDIARINEDGNYVILGRKSDMIKINGNRIEPAEIEAAVKKVLGVDWAFAKGFVEPERSFIVVYYTANINIDYASVREELMKVLPTYMIPSYFVHLDEVPHLSNGKVDRQALRAPEIEQYRTEYVAPENELEERICAEMEKVLGTKDGIPLGRPDEKRIGVNDDFYLLGGDSLRTIELVTNLNIEDLTVTDIYAARTPRLIANRWMAKMIEERDA